MARRTRALPALARPCSRRCAPLSSGGCARHGNLGGIIHGGRFVADSPLEESGFEPLVPLATEMLIELANATRMLAVGDIGPVPRSC
jgi:hypothetical protein